LAAISQCIFIHCNVIDSLPNKISNSVTKFSKQIAQYTILFKEYQCNIKAVSILFNFRCSTNVPDEMVCHTFSEPEVFLWSCQSVQPLQGAVSTITQAKTMYIDTLYLNGIINMAYYMS